MKTNTSKTILFILLGGAGFSIGFFYPKISENPRRNQEIRTASPSQSPTATAPEPKPTPKQKPRAIQTNPSGKPTQFVILSFDGSESPQMWRDTIDFSDQMTASGSPVKFTYFVSGVYFLDYIHRDHYAAPQNPRGYSRIGFGLGKNDILQRIKFINEAESKGNEIGSHANGHFDGTAWNLSDWDQELSAFKDLLFNAGQNIQVVNPENYRLNFGPDAIRGFRAPGLGKGAELFDALKKNGFRYDVSISGASNGWPYKLGNGLWEIPLPSIYFAGTKNKLLAMDYNFYVKQSGAKDLAIRSTPLWDQYYNEVLQSYRDYFNANYAGNRAPVIMAGHFSRWNDGVYFAAMKQFAEETCGKAEVRCGTYNELVDYMEARTANN